ncbi:hypothetical protein D4R51_00115 [bacterium]|nr:MAG: hypothetical protein D4R51_00115 [bacterium]
MITEEKRLNGASIELKRKIADLLTGEEAMGSGGLSFVDILEELKQSQEDRKEKGEEPILVNRPIAESLVGELIADGEIDERWGRFFWVRNHFRGLCHNFINNKCSCCGSLSIEVGRTNPHVKICPVCETWKPLLPYIRSTCEQIPLLPVS